MRYSNAINGYSSINLTKVDILSPLKQIKIGVGYRRPDGSKYQGNFPASLEELATLKTDYEVLPGWESDITGITEYEKLPKNCQNYIETIEQLINVPVTWIGTGPDRANTIMKPIKF